MKAPLVKTQQNVSTLMKTHSTVPVLKAGLELLVKKRVSFSVMFGCLKQNYSSKKFLGLESVKHRHNEEFFEFLGIVCISCLRFFCSSSMR